MKVMVFIVWTVLLLSGLDRPAVCGEVVPAAGSAYALANEHFQTGRTLAAQKSWAAATEEFKAAVFLNPKFGAAYFFLGLCDLQQHRAHESIEDLQKALANTSDIRLLASAHYDLGVAYRISGNQALSDAEYQAAVRLYPPYANLPIIHHPPPPATGAATAPLSVDNHRVPWGLYFLLFAAFGLIGWMFVRRPRAAKSVSAPDAPNPVPSASVTWRIEPELLSPVMPRQVKIRPKAFLMPALFLLTFGGILFPFWWPASQRWFILRNGVPGNAELLGKRVELVGRHQTRQTYLKLAYQSQSGQPETAEILVDWRAARELRKALPIHYLPEHPNWAALDDDYGATSADMFVIKFMFSLLLLIEGAFAYVLAKERRVLRWGIPVGATLTRLGGSYKGTQKAFFSYEIAGQKMEGCARIMAGSLQAGQVVTGLVDARKPKKLIVYSQASFRLLGS